MEKEALDHVLFQYPVAIYVWAFIKEMRGLLCAPSSSNWKALLKQKDGALLEEMLRAMSEARVGCFFL